ncbi:hypothetical protein IXO812_12500 [Xanthomonas oryzae pv. oryzae]|nr:hypothetical protein IXO812_12500 [Xanthomonas oryzae pv. oryzae]
MIDVNHRAQQIVVLRGREVCKRERGRFTRRFDLTRLVPGLLAAAAASKPWSERALRDVTMFTAESAC